LNVYELINTTVEMAKEIKEKILYEPAIDKVYEDIPNLDVNEKAFRVEYHKGQFNQREDSTNEMIQKFLNYDDVEVKHSKIIVLRNISEEKLEKIKLYYINPIESKEVGLNSFHYEKEDDNAKEIEIIHGFVDMSTN